MGNTETITLEGVEFRVFRKLPVPIAREVQSLQIDMLGDDYEGTVEDLQSGTHKAIDMKNLNINILYEIYDVLLTKAVLSPKITKDDIQNIDHELQLCFQDLSELLLDKFTTETKRIKKKSSS